MARLDKKTKAELIMLCNERGSEIEHLKQKVQKIQEQFDITDKALVEARKRYHALEGDFKDSEEQLVKQIKEINLKAAKDVQDLRNQVIEKDKAISMQEASYKDLKASYDELVYKNGINRSNACKYKLTTIAFIILFII